MILKCRAVNKNVVEKVDDKPLMLGIKQEHWLTQWHSQILEMPGHES